MPRPALVLGVIVLGSALCARVASADWAMVEVTGGDAAQGRLVRKQAEAALRSAGFDVLSVEAARAVGPSPRELERCVGEGPACMRAALVAAEVSRLLLIQLEPARGATTVRARAYDGATGKLLRAEERRCAPCKEAALGPIVDQAVTAALGLPAAGTNAVATKPVETKPVETTAAETTASGTTMESRAAVGPAPVASASVPPGPRGFGVWKWVALGSGVALTGLGITGMVIDGPRFAADGSREPERWSTMGHGVAATVVGAGLLGLAGYMIYEDTKASGARARVALEPLGTGLSVGLAGTF